MRKATSICFLLLALCSVTFGQSPQWTVVQNVVLYGQSQAISPTTLLTPSDPGMYRITMYFSTVSGISPIGTFNALYSGTDVSGVEIGDGSGAVCGKQGFHSSVPLTVSLKPNAPLTYQVRADIPPSSSCVYNLAITVEQLLQP